MKRNMKKLLSLGVAAVMLLGSGIALAVDNDPPITNPSDSVITDQLKNESKQSVHSIVTRDPNNVGGNEVNLYSSTINLNEHHISGFLAYDNGTNFGGKGAWRFGLKIAAPQGVTIDQNSFQVTMDGVTKTYTDLSQAEKDGNYVLLYPTFQNTNSDYYASRKITVNVKWNATVSQESISIDAYNLRLQREDGSWPTQMNTLGITVDPVEEDGGLGYYTVSRGKRYPIRMIAEPIANFAVDELIKKGVTITATVPEYDTNKVKIYKAGTNEEIAPNTKLTLTYVDEWELSSSDEVMRGTFEKIYYSDVIDIVPLGEVEEKTRLLFKYTYTNLHPDDHPDEIGDFSYFIGNENNENKEEPKPTEKEDTVTGVGVTTTNGQDLTGVDLKVKPMSAEYNQQALEKMNVVLSDNVNKTEVFDISLVKADQVFQLENGKFQVSIPLPEGFDPEKVMIYRLNEDGTVEAMPTRVEDGMVIFETEHFSLYAVAEVKDMNKALEQAKGNPSSDNPKTSDPMSVMAIAFMGFSALGASGVLARKRK